MNRFLYNLTARLPCRLIAQEGGTPYLERYYLGQILGVTFYLHRFVGSDGDRHAHNHPWTWARALVLSGGYIEEAVTDLTTSTDAGYMSELRTIRWWNKINGNHFHRIVGVEPGTWTLFFHSKRQTVQKGCCRVPKGWGFLGVEQIGLRVVTLFHPYPSARPEWWTSAPRGNQSKRQPL